MLTERIVYLITSCPTPTTPLEHILTQKCINTEKSPTFDMITPVYHITTQVSYKNIYCAMCHKVNVFNNEIISWIYGFDNHCESYYVSLNYTIKQILDNDLCGSVYLWKNIFICDYQHSQLPYVKSCPHNASPVQKLKCARSATSLIFDSNMYKNSDCAICNNVVPPKNPQCR